MIEKDSIWRMMERVYGFCDLAALGDFIAANPEIGNPDSVPTGALLRLPVIERFASRATAPSWWLAAWEGNSMPDAYRVAFERSEVTPLRLLPLLRPDGSRGFLVAAAGPFETQELAEQAQAEREGQGSLRFEIARIPAGNILLSLAAPSPSTVAVSTP